MSGRGVLKVGFFLISGPHQGWMPVEVSNDGHQNEQMDIQKNLFNNQAKTNSGGDI